MNMYNGYECDEKRNRLLYVGVHFARSLLCATRYHAKLSRARALLRVRCYATRNYRTSDIIILCDSFSLCTNEHGYLTKYSDIESTVSLPGL